jgi:hypothetical protein
MAGCLLALAGRSGRRPDSGPTARVRIGMTDVDRFRTTVGLFAQLDGRFGGGHARQSLVQYLSADANRLLHGRYTDAVGLALFTATAEATLLAAWMTYGSSRRELKKKVGLGHFLDY